MKRPFSPLVVSPAALEVPITEFKTKCLAMTDAVHAGRIAEIVITKRGKSVAKLVPFEVAPRTLFGFASGKISFHGNVFRTGDRWDGEDAST